MSTGTISRRLTTALLHARLEAIPGAPVSVYDGEAPTDPPVYAGQAGDPTEQRVAPYVVHYASTGDPVIEPDLVSCHTELTVTFQLVAVAGWKSALEDLVDRLHPWLYLWTPPPTGDAVYGRVTVPPGYDPGPVRRNDSVTPSRFWTPLQYRVQITT